MPNTEIFPSTCTSSVYYKRKASVLDSMSEDPSDGLQDVRQRRSKLKQQGVKPSIVAEVCVLRSVACSERDSGPIVGGPAPQLALKSSMLALQASALWWLSLLYAQLQCHMMSCDTSNEEDSDQQYEAFCLCLGIVARHLADDGEYDRALVLLGAAKNHFSLLSQHMPYKLISCCIEELGLARALGVRDVAAARLHRANMATYHQHRAMYASALIAMSEGSYHAALLETQCVLEAQRRGNSITFKPNGKDNIHYRVHNTVLWHHLRTPPLKCQGAVCST
eukprot:Em0008g758a